MQVTALKQFPYDKKTRKEGETFEMSDEDARLMIGFGKVEKAKPRRSYNRRDMVAEQ